MSKPSLGTYLWAAFNARPIGMFVPPNWIGLGLFGLLGVINPGFWLLGVGLELGYLYTLVNSARFRRTVDGAQLLDQRQVLLDRQREMVERLAPEDRNRYVLLASRCQSILRQQQAMHGAAEIAAQNEGLGRLLWIYLRLLVTRMSLRRLLEEAAGGPTDIDDRIAELEKQIAAPKITAALRTSYNGQLDILRQRKDRQAEARQRLDFVDSELTRIAEQVELIREQAIVSAEPQAVSQRIDEIAATLGGTTQWIGQQQQMYSQVEDLLTDPPPLVVPDESQRESA